MTSEENENQKLSDDKLQNTTVGLDIPEDFRSSLKIDSENQKVSKKPSSLAVIVLVLVVIALVSIFFLTK